MTSAPTNPTTLSDAYAATHAASAQRYDTARGVFPGGVTHDQRFLDPFPIYVARAQGSRKWDVDGNEIIDYAMGHGALLLGHSHPAVTEAVVRQASSGTHFGACHELEIAWGQWVQRLIPSAERLRFTASGTEATMMALRLARQYTGRRKVVKFEGHFHGWNDYLIIGANPPFDQKVHPGIPDEVVNLCRVVPANNLKALADVLANDDDIAAIILEPTGASWGAVPLAEGFVQGVRDLATKHNVVLIFDEVITGFRVSPGGYQAASGITPDLTTLAKILAGGLPGGAIAGRAQFMEPLELRDDPDWNQRVHIRHHGTFNANPLSAAAGVACLSIVSTGEPHAIANRLADRLRDEMNEVLAQHGARAFVYGDSSVWHVYAGPEADVARPARPLTTIPAAALKGVPKRVSGAIKRALIHNGVDTLGTGGLVSAVHTDDDITRTVEAWDRAVRQLIADGVIQTA